MEDKKEDDKNNKEEKDDFMKCIRDIMGLKQKPTIPKLPINKKIQNKFLKDHVSKKKANNSNSKNTQENNKEITKKIIYPSGIIKTLIKNENNKIINEVVDYENLKPNYINNIKENIDKELIRLIENSFLLYNRRPVIRNIVKKPFSTKVLEERILLWKYLIKNFSKDEKALLIRKLLYYLGKVSERIYEEFIQIKEIAQAYLQFKLKGRIHEGKSINKKAEAWCEANNLYMMNSTLGYDQDGNPEKEKEPDPNREEMKAMILLQHCRVLNIKNELNGTGWGYVFLKELKELSEMYTNSTYILNSIFYECYDIFEDENNIMFHLFNKTETVRILWNFFVDYFIDDSFVMKFLIELKFIFGVYQQDEVVKYIHDLVLYRWNLHGMLDMVKKNLVRLIGPEEIFDEKEKVEKMDNIDDVMKYIEGDEKPKKKKKKKKKNQNKINTINEIEDDKGCDNFDKDNNEEDFIDTDDSLSIISEADSVLDSFKHDLIEETEFNTGNKVIPTLSSEFLNQLQNNL